MRFWITFAVGAFFMAVLAYGLHSVSVNHLEKKHKEAMEAQAAKLQGQCLTAKLTTERISNAYQKDLLDLDRDYAVVLNSLPSCPAASGPALMVPYAASGHDAAPAGRAAVAGIAGRYEPRRIAGIVRKGQKYQFQLKRCQQYVNDVKEAATKNQR